MHKRALLISILSLLSALFFNEINFKTLKNEYPTELADQYTIGTPDDVSYLVPPVNYLNGKGWRSNDAGIGAYIFRTPGYGSFYLFNYLIAGKHAMLLLRTLQLLLFVFSVYLLFLSILKLTQNNFLSIILSSIYGILPFTQGFIYYSLTEGITPFFVILYAYLIIAAYKNENIKQLYFAAITLAVLIIIRPQMLLLSFAFLPYLFKLLKLKSLKNAITAISIIVISFSLLGIWQIRNYSITHRWEPLNAIYNADNNSIFRPPHFAITNFYRSFGSDGPLFHSSVYLIWHHALTGDTSSTYIEEVVNKIPVTITEGIGKEKITSAFKLYQLCSYEQKDQINQKTAIPAIITSNETACINAFDQLTNDVYRKCFLFSRVYVPVKTFLILSAHSNLSMHIFQHDWKGKWWMEMLRWICAMIHLSLFIIFFVQLFFRKDALSFLLLLVPMMYLFYLCFFTIIIEERYTLPLLPILILGAARVFQSIYETNFYMSFRRNLVKSNH